MKKISENAAAAQPAATDEGAPARNGAPLGGFVRDAIGRSLQAHFDDIVNTPVPDKFLVLLAELEAKERKHDG
jgi:hypothetical protein